MKDEVDVFVIAESNKTHSNRSLSKLADCAHQFAQTDDARGRDKPLLLEEALRHVDARLRERVVRVVVGDMPDSDDAWVLEHWQRDALIRGLGSRTQAGLGPAAIALPSRGLLGLQHVVGELRRAGAGPGQRLRRTSPCPPSRGVLDGRSARPTGRTGASRGEERRRRQAGRGGGTWCW